jgi:hypothetical protein
MKIKSNTTTYDTRAIRTAICVAHDRLAKTEGRLKQWKRVVVDVVYARTRVTHGCASIGGTYMKLVLMGPRAPKVFLYDDVPLVCPHCESTSFKPTQSCKRVDGVTFDGWEHTCKERAESPVTVQRLMALIDHELRHLYGIEHAQMRGIYTKTMWALEQEEAAWANDHPSLPWKTLPVKKVPERVAVPPVDLIGEKLVTLAAREKAWTTKLKRAQTALTKLRAKRRYHERRMAAFSGGSGT